MIDASGDMQYSDKNLENNCNAGKTVRELGYDSATGLLGWLRKATLDKVSKPVPRDWKINYPEDLKEFVYQRKWFGGS